MSVWHSHYPVINHHGKKYEKEYIHTHKYIYIYKYQNHFAIQQKLTQCYKSTILQ